MTAGSIFLGIALLIAVLTYLTYPFWGAEEQERRERRSKRDLLNEQKEAILAQMRSLDFDFETGKIPEELHGPQRAQLLAEATAVLQELDTLSGKRSRVATDDDIEAAIARARQAKPAGDGHGSADDAIEAAIAHARTKPSAPTATANGKRSRFCPQCGQAVDPTDKFCSTCGHKLLTKATK
ncbi:MAG: zinc ribbon domain-containing protein [Ardenticatenaceae bacterium]|nr:zinc ribbon domain-containing protein [Anaerolineales bacterium]MCB8923212.1 zinc ribbon domain-containing protein [Ardenticatenaceae bacterium]MCB9004843.1 zinc ribbon domain-containing protein [Ardenticatenaceae bacterium]